MLENIAIIVSVYNHIKMTSKLWRSTKDTTKYDPKNMKLCLPLELNEGFFPSLGVNDFFLGLPSMIDCKSLINY